MSRASLTGTQRALSASSPPRTSGSSPAGKSKWNACVIVRPRRLRSGWSNTCWPLIEPLSTGDGDLQPGLFAQLAQAGIQDRLLLPDEATRQRPQALAGLGAAAHQQHVAGMDDDRIGGDEGRRVRRVLPRGAVVLDELVLGDQLRVAPASSCGTPRACRTPGRHVAAQHQQGAVAVDVTGVEQVAAQLGRRQRLGVLDVDQPPLRELAQVVAGGILVHADQADACTRRPRHRPRWPRRRCAARRRSTGSRCRGGPAAGG